MPLPFSKSSRGKSADVIDVAASPSTPRAIPVPPTLASVVAPDLGDYSTQYPEPLPGKFKWIPVAFYSLMALTLAFSGWTYLTSKRISDQLRVVRSEISRRKEEDSRLSKKAEEIAVKMGDLNALQYWANTSAPTREILAAVAVASNQRVQIRTIELTRREGNINRYTLVVSCNGTTTTFNQMREILNKSLSAAMWGIQEAPIEAGDQRLVYDAVLTKGTRNGSN